MTIPELPRAMAKLAEYAAAPPADLLERVNARRRRQRQRRAALTAAVAVAAVTAGSLVALKPPSPQPPEPPAPVTSFRLPPMPGSPPVLSDTWPKAIVTRDLPEIPIDATVGVPDRLLPVAPVVIGRVESKLLVGVEAPDTGAASEPSVQGGRLWTFDPARRRYQSVVEFATGATGIRAAVTGGAIVVISTNWFGGKLTRTVLFRQYSGKNKIASADIANTETISGTYADDWYGYWNAESEPDQVRIFRMPFAAPSGPGGAVGGDPGKPMEGFDGLVSDGSGWAHNAESTVFRNLSTGERRQAVAPAGSDEFRCVPAFCLGHDATGWFVQQLDGSERALLPYHGVPVLVGGLLLLADGVLLDPVSGRYGAVTRDPHCELRASQAKADLMVTWRTKQDGACTGPRTTAYLAPSD